LRIIAMRIAVQISPELNYGTDRSSHVAKRRSRDKVENGQDLARCHFY